MTLTNEEIVEFDRKMRSFITAMLLENELEMGELILEVRAALIANPDLSAALMSTFGGLVCYLLQMMSDEPFEVWAGISQHIELEALRD